MLKAAKLRFCEGEKRQEPLERILANFFFSFFLKKI